MENAWLTHNTKNFLMGDLLKMGKKKEAFVPLS